MSHRPSFTVRPSWPQRASRRLAAPSVRWWPALALACLAGSACSGEMGDAETAGLDGAEAPAADPMDPTAADGTSTAMGEQGSSEQPGNVAPTPGSPSAPNGNPQETPGAGTEDSPGGAETPMPPSAGASGATPPSAAGSGSSGCGTPDVSPSVLRRLSRLEYQLTLKELFQLGQIPSVEAVPPDSDFKGFRTLSELHNVTTEHLRGYQEVATELAEELLADGARADAIVGCDVAAAGCLESFVVNFGRVAYRRNLTDDEVAALLDVADETGGSGEEQFSAVVAAMLSSASFLYRMELGDSPEGLTTLTGEELASRLSFTLLGRGPSAALLDRGVTGELDSEAGLAAAAQELLADERSQEYFRAFFKQWLDFEQLRAPNEPSPDWHDALMLSMTEETEQFLDEYAWTPGINFLDALTANHSYMRADLAEFYGLPAPAANGLVQFPEGHNRENSGLLTHASLISAKGDGDKIAHRGAWVQKTFFCIELEVPTALLDAISDELEGLTYQQMLDKRNTETACAGCHALIDPIGAGFSQYDAAGQFDPEVNTSQFGIIPALPPNGTEFSTIGELAAQIRTRPEVGECLTERLFLYTAGRQASGVDTCTVASAAERFTDQQGQFAAILEGLVLAPEFRMRRAPEISQQ